MKKNHAILSNDIILLYSYYQYVIIMSQEKTRLHFSFITYQKLEIRNVQFSNLNQRIIDTKWLILEL
jgi:hypothetical protein